MQDCKNRIQYIDIAKGIAIILMVLGHKGIPQALSNFIWSFHMPLFFICSGIVTNFGRDLFEFSYHRLKTLILPFFVYSAIVYMLYQFTDEPISLHQLLSTGWGGYALWFIPVLFVSSICAKMIFIISSALVRWIVVLAFLFMGCWLSHTGVCFPWAMSSVPFATFLIFLGSELKGVAALFEKQSKIRLLMSIPTFFLINTIISHYWRLDICANKILPIIPLTIGALSGTFMVFAISSLITTHSKLVSKVLTSVGRETYIIVAFSQIIIPFVNLIGLAIPPVVKNVILIVVLIMLTCIKNFLKGMLKKV